MGLSKKTSRREINRHASGRGIVAHVPLVTGDRAEGVLTVRLDNPPTLEQRELLDAFAAQLALFVNKERALEESRDRASRAPVAKTSKDTFRFRLARIEDATRGHVRRLATASNPIARNYSKQSRRLTRTVDHLLDATRLESGLAPAGARMVRSGRTFARSGRGLRIERQTAVRVNIATDLPDYLCRCPSHSTGSGRFAFECGCAWEKQ